MSYGVAASELLTEDVRRAFAWLREQPSAVTSNSLSERELGSCPLPIFLCAKDDHANIPVYPPGFVRGY